MARLIDADLMIETLEECKQMDHEPLTQKVADAMIRMAKLTPTADAVEVVRCKDCKHFTPGMAIGMCKRDKDKPILPIPCDHFCSFGVKRIGGYI